MAASRVLACGRRPCLAPFKNGSCSRPSWLSGAAVLQGNWTERYLQESRVPTMHFQESLPRLPLPSLTGTGERYLSALRPLVTDEDYFNTEKLVKEFCQENSDGWALNWRLKTRDTENRHTSYIAEYWYDMYLRDRRPLILNQNPFMAFQPDPRNPSQADRATNFVNAAVRFYNSLMDDKLNPEIYHMNPERTDTEWFKTYCKWLPGSLAWYGAYMFNVFPLDMVQYKRLFYSTRIPKKDKDELVSFPSSRHILVLKNQHMYLVPVQEPNGLPVDPDQLHASFLAIIKDHTPSPDHCIGYLTSTDRNEWAAARQELIADPHNAALLEKVDSAFFILCFDDSEPTEAPEASRVFLHNFGASRWMDKSFQLIVCQNGQAAVNFEHAWGDGVAVLRFFNDTFKETTKNPWIPPSSPSPGPLPERLEFRLTDSVKSAVEKAREEVESRCRSLTVSAMQYHKYGKNLFKPMGLSADGVMQLAFQVAYYRMFRHVPATYESCTTAGFKHGRTETVRPASVATLACTHAMEPGSDFLMGEKKKLLESAVRWHSTLVRDALTGNGFDRHLMALRCLAESEGLSMPLFQDSSYAHINHIILSTSTLASDAVLLGGFGPVTPEGYGVGYGVKDDMLGCNISTYPTRDGPAFLDTLRTVLDEIHEIVTTPQQPDPEDNN